MPLWKILNMPNKTYKKEKGVVDTLNYIVSARLQKNMEGIIKPAVHCPVCSLQSVPAYHNKNQQTPHLKNFITKTNARGLHEYKCKRAIRKVSLTSLCILPQQQCQAIAAGFHTRNMTASKNGNTAISPK